jgi:hypothetical protein
MCHSLPFRTNNRQGVELVWEKSFLSVVKDKKRSNRDIVQKVWEDIWKEMGWNEIIKMLFEWF